MSDIVERLRSIYELNGDTFSSMEVFAACNLAADEIERLRAFIKKVALAEARKVLP